MVRRTLLVAAALVVILVATAYFGYYESTASAGKATNCSITGVGGFEFRVVSSVTGSSITGETIKAVDRLGCEGETQVIYLDNFSEAQGGGGWLVPDFPALAIPGGQLSFTVAYQGETYTFTASAPPVGTNCVTLSIPSGNMTTTTVMNGNGSFCSQG